MTLPTKAGRERPSGLGVQKEAKPISPQELDQVVFDQEIEKALEGAKSIGGLYQGEAENPQEVEKEVAFTEELGKTGSDDK